MGKPVVNIPHLGEHLATSAPFGESMITLCEQVRALVEARLGASYRVIDIEASMRVSYGRPSASRGEIDPARIPPYVLEPGRMTFDVQAKKLPDEEIIELRLAVVSDGVRVANVSIHLAL